MERRLSCLVFTGQLKQVRFVASYKCGEGRWVFDFVWQVITTFCWSVAEGIRRRCLLAECWGWDDMSPVELMQSLPSYVVRPPVTTCIVAWWYIGSHLLVCMSICTGNCERLYLQTLFLVACCNKTGLYYAEVSLPICLSQLESHLNSSRYCSCTLCPEKNGTASILCTTFTKFNKLA